MSMIVQSSAAVEPGVTTSGLPPGDAHFDERRPPAQDPALSLQDGSQTQSPAQPVPAYGELPRLMCLMLGLSQRHMSRCHVLHACNVGQQFGTGLQFYFLRLLAWMQASRDGSMCASSGHVTR